jgi:hypothetical protein
MLPRAFWLVVLGIAALPLFVSAQSFNNTAPFSLSITPQYPAPFSEAVLTPISNQVDISNAIMTVLVGGKQIYQGAAQSLAIPLGAAGTVTTVKVTMTSNGSSFSQTFSLRPQDIALIAEPVSTAPVLYAGKPLVPLEGSVRMVAIANFKDSKGKPVDAAKLSYSWTVDDTRIADGSGIGKDTLLVASPRQYRSRDVSVSVQSQDGSVSSGASFTLSPQEPIVRLYENDPLLGILYDRAIADSFSIQNVEKSLFAAPYSFPSGPMTLSWFLNGARAQTGNAITLRPTGAGAGAASLSFTATSGDSVTTTTNLSLSFGAAKGGLGIFGL